MRGADLCEVDLSKLPLTRLGGGLEDDERLSATEGEHKKAIALMNKTKLREAQLQGADLTEAKLEKVKLTDAILADKNGIGPQLADVQWNNINPAVVDWSQVKQLGDEHVVRQNKERDGEVKPFWTQLIEYKAVVRANRQLAVVLRDQGLNEEADRFAYRAQLLQRVVFRRQKKFGRYLLSLFLDLLAGHGYKPERSVFWYVTMACGFALAYHFLGHLTFWSPDAFIYSLTSFYGRGFFPGLEHTVTLHDR